MGTRGSYGFRTGEQDKLTYNHFDSYPTGLGGIMVKFIKDNTNEQLAEYAERMIMVNDGDTPTEQQMAVCQTYFNDNVATGRQEDWYCLLREAQGHPDAYKNGLVYMIDGASFMNDSLFCEYAYVINMDTKMLEFYKGFNKDAEAVRRES